MSRTTVYLQPIIKRKLVEISAEQQRSMSSIINECLALQIAGAHQGDVLANPLDDNQIWAHEQKERDS